MSDNPVLRRIRDETGFAQKLGKHLGISREAVWMWKKVPPKHAFRVAKFMRITVAEVCPDLVPQPAPTFSRRKRAAPEASPSK